MDVITAFSSKGGVAKTTILMALAGELNKLGFKVLVVDADATGSLSRVLGVSDVEVGLGELILASPQQNTALLPKALVPTEHFGMVIAPGEELDQVETVLAAKPRKEERLTDLLSMVKDRFDFTLVDSGRRGLLSTNVLCAATGVFVPVQTSLMGIDAVQDTLATLERVKITNRRNFEIIGVLPTRYLWNRSVHNMALKSIQSTDYSELYPHQKHMLVLKPMEELTAFEKMAAMGKPAHMVKDFEKESRYENVSAITRALLAWKGVKDARLQPV
jgi:chromosome partitioning protein